MTLRPVAYRKRIVDDTITRMMSSIRAVSIEGPKWCGKTWTSLNHANSVFYVADPAGGFANRQLATLDLSAVLAGDTPRAIDEWQEVPGIWDAVRFEADMRTQPGQFILTGSSTPADHTVVHSGTGRIARVRMRPMTLVESGHSTGGASLDAILRGERLAVTQSTSSLDTIIDLVTRGGWPGSMDYPLEQAADLAANYLDSIAIAEISQVSNSHRDSYKVMALLRSLARNTATVVGLPTIERDISKTSDTQLSINTIRDYLTWLERLYVLEHIPAWNPALRSPVKLRQAPKRMLVDPSLAVAGLRATPADLKADPKTLGFLFESMMLRDLLVYAHHMRATLWHYRDDADLEVDAVLTLPSGQWAAIEIKLGYTQLDSAAATLLRLHRKMADSGDPPPTALIVIVGVGGIAHQRDDGVYVIPADLLGP